MATSFNVMGFQAIADGGIPQTFTAYAGGNISGGQLCYLVSGATRVVTSGASSFISNDLVAAPQASGVNYPVGVATHNVASGTNNTVSLLTKGVIIMRTDGALVTGQLVQDSAGKGSIQATSGTGANTDSLMLQHTIGRALLAAGSNTYTPVMVNL